MGTLKTIGGPVVLPTAHSAVINDKMLLTVHFQTFTFNRFIYGSLSLLDLLTYIDRLNTKNDV